MSQPINNVEDPARLGTMDVSPVKKAAAKYKPGKGHKADCICVPCKARRRQKEALPFPIGAGGTPVASSEEASEGKIVLEPMVVEGETVEIVKRDKTRNVAAQVRVRQWLELRILEPGITNLEVARRLGIRTDTLSHYITRGTKEGWLKFDNPIDRIEFDIVPKVVENLDYFLKRRDKQVTIETAKGTIFKQYQEAKGISDAPQTVLALKIEAAPLGGNEAPIKAVVVGKARSVVDVKPTIEEEA